MRRYSLIILAAALGLLVHPCGDALAGPAREGITPRPNQAAPIQSAKPGGPTASAPFVVVIDPGHGGRDSGSRGALLLEKDFALRAAAMLAALLSRRPEVKAILTREADTEMTAVQRASVANYNAASLFLTLHADASWRPGRAGARDSGGRAPPSVARGGGGSPGRPRFAGSGARTSIWPRTAASPWDCRDASPPYVQASSPRSTFWPCAISKARACRRPT